MELSLRQDLPGLREPPRRSQPLNSQAGNTTTATMLDFSLGFVMCERELRRFQMFQLFYQS